MYDEGVQIALILANSRANMLGKLNAHDDTHRRARFGEVRQVGHLSRVPCTTAMTRTALVLFRISYTTM
jgi:hypothetical protein